MNALFVMPEAPKRARIRRGGWSWGPVASFETSREARDWLDALSAVRLAQPLRPLPFRPIAAAPRDGTGILAYGLHDRDDAPGAACGVRAGDHWFAILLWDRWREPHGWVFSKDGMPAWTPPLAFCDLEPPDLASLAAIHAPLEIPSGARSAGPAGANPGEGPSATSAQVGAMFIADEDGSCVTAPRAREGVSPPVDLARGPDDDGRQPA